MTLRLIILRHAKSDWSSGAQSDHERPLNRRGRRDAPRIGQHLAKLGWQPDVVFSSDAQRTRDTWDGMSEHLDDCPIEFLNQFYLAGLDAIESQLSPLTEHAQTVLVLGHNPGWEEAATELAGIAIEMTTANAILLETQATSWADAFRQQSEHENAFELRAIVRPRELDD